MSSIGSVAGGSTSHQLRQKEMFSKIDADEDGSITKQEMVSARPTRMSEEEAGLAYAALDTEGDGAVSFEQFSSAASQAPESKLSGAAMDVLMLMGPQGGMMPQGGNGGAGAEDVFDSLDTNQDGTVSQAEFLAGKPEDMTEEQASSLFDALDSQGSGSITEDQLAESMMRGAGRPPMGPPPPDMTTASGSQTSEANVTQDTASVIV